MVLLDAPLLQTSQTETEQDRRPIKRPRMGSVSTNTAQTQLKSRSQTVRSTGTVSRESSSDEMYHEPVQPRLPACSS